MSRVFPVILSGGSGSRLWPLSRQTHPKQFLRLINDESLFQTTLRRLSGMDFEDPLAICNEEHRFLITEQAKEINQPLSSIILEPLARNTAPAIGLAAFQLKNSGHQDDLMMVMPSDHVINDIKKFQTAINHAMQGAKNDMLVTFGIKPSYPETGYGYIKVFNLPNHGLFDVENFVEKPSLEVAEQYIQSGDYFWNSGMFMFKVSTFLSALKAFEPEMYQACEISVNLAKSDLDFFRVDRTSFENSPSNSIDYAIMEKAKNVVLIPLDAGWSDVGSWPSLWDIQEKDSQANVLHGDVIAIDSKSNYIHSTNRLVTLIGVNDLMVVETSDALLVASKEKSQDVKKIVSQLVAEGRSEADIHQTQYRPWGKFNLVDDGNNFKVKRITIKPKEKLSLQLHHHRAEHWVVVSGTAKVQLGDEIITLKENQSIYIPMGAKHSLENPTERPLELIEIQTGAYLGEDDIVRFEDRYGRN